MSDIFLSHSSDDDEVAKAVNKWLQEQSHRVFLDFDKQAGIKPGRDWERVLYQNLQSCRAVIVLCSRASMESRWVFAEITHARALGKHIFPVVVEACEMDSILADHQAVNLVREGDKAFGRLADGLGIAGIDARDSFPWDQERSPYPGLLAFDEKDAAIFFGRGKEIGNGLDLLHQVSRYHGRGLVMVLGASGSGKSSLVRAGLLPRLRRDEGKWLIVDPFRPLGDPMRELSEALSRAFRGLGQERDPSAIKRDLLAAASALDRSAAETPNPLVDLCSAMRQAREESPGERENDPRALVIIDQFEELLGEKNAPGRRFLSFLRSTLEKPDVPLVVLGTMRSDFLGILQQASALRGFEFRSLSVGPMPMEALREVIEKPAQMADLLIDPDLVQAILDDAETADALPLVAFTLRELYEGYGDNQRLELHEYRDKLGGLQGSIAKAAEEALTGAGLDETELRQLRQAFLKLVRLNEEGQFARRTAAWSELPEGSHAVLERFVKARLLMSGGEGAGRTLEVAHEAMFRAWDRLVTWLEEGREELQLSRIVANAAKAWLESGRSQEYLLPAGRLQRVLELDAEDRLTMGDTERAFVTASDQVVKHKRRMRQLWTGLGIAFLAGVALAMTNLWWRAERERERTELQASRVLAVQARTTLDTKLDLSLLLSLESFLVADTLASRTSLNAGLGNEPQFRRFLHGHEGNIWSVDFSPDGVTLGSAGDDGNVLLWDLKSGQVRARMTPAGGGRVLSIDFHPDGRTLVAGAEDGAVSLWSTSRGKRREDFQAKHGARVLSVAFDPTGNRIASGAADGTVAVWDVASGSALHSFSEKRGWVWSVAFAPNGKRLASADLDGAILVHNLVTGEVQKLKEQEAPGLLTVAFSPDGRSLVAGRGDGKIQFWDLETRKPSPPLAHGGGGDIRGVAYSPDGSFVAVASSTGAVQVWDTAKKTLRFVLPGFGAGATDVGLDSYGRVLASAGDDGAVRVWDIWRSVPELALGGHTHQILAVAFSADGRRVVSSDRNGNALVHELGTGEFVELAAAGVEGGPRAHAGEIWGLAMRPDGGAVATASGSDPVRLWEMPGGQAAAELRPEGEIAAGEFVWALAMGAAAAQQYVASANDTGVVRVWDMAGKRFLRELTPPVEPAASASPPDKAKPAPVYAVAFNPDATRLAAVTTDGRAHLWEVGGDWRHSELSGRLQESSGIAFDRTGTTLAAGGAKGKILVWNVESGGQPMELGEQEGRIRSLAFRSDGLRLLSGGQDGSLVLWAREDPTDRFEPLLELLGHTSEVYYVGFDREDENRVVSASDRILRWDLVDLSDREVVRERVCTRVGRNLTRGEWADFLGVEKPYRATCEGLTVEPEEAATTTGP